MLNDRPPDYPQRDGETMPRYFDLAEMKEFGDRGVEIVLSALKKRRPKTLVHASKAGSNNYDILIKSRPNPHSDWCPHMVEVISDRHPSRNFYLEVIEKSESNQPGLIMMTPAEYLAFYFFKNSMLYLFKTKDIREWVETHRMGYEHLSARTPTENGFFTTYGIAVPKTVLAPLSVSIQDFFQELTEGEQK